MEDGQREPTRSSRYETPASSPTKNAHPETTLAISSHGVGRRVVVNARVDQHGLLGDIAHRCCCTRFSTRHRLEARMCPVVPHGPPWFRVVF